MLEPTPTSPRTSATSSQDSPAASETSERSLGSLLLTAVGTLVGTATAVVAIRAVLLAAELRDWGALASIGALTLFCVWGSGVLWKQLLFPDVEQSLGGKVALSGFLAGSVLSLYAKPGHVLEGELAESTSWQTAMWAIGVFFAIAGFELERQRSVAAAKEAKEGPDPTPPAPSATAY